MDDYLNPPPGWHYSVHPWFALDDIPELPELMQVGTVLLPEFFHLAVGTKGMWAEGWPDEDDFALFLHFHVFDGELTLNEARSAGMDLPVAYEKFRKIVPTRRWKPMAVALMTRYLADFMEEGGRPDADMEPAHGPRSVAAYENRPSAAMRWIDKLQTQAAEAYAVARDQPPPAQTKRKRNRITDEFLYEVAQVYLSADKFGLPPTREVANRFDAPHSTAAKWVASARRKGFLPPPGVRPLSDSEIESALNERRLELEHFIKDSYVQYSIIQEKDPEKKAQLEAELKAAKEELAQLGELPGRDD
ncbi:hypothetical protein RM704_15720 [Streptomyces sp. DSM 3412]|uniref:Uncharacterized protein n=1 Tax=Streptomyces gottesmaniae TaxID=3075518 RepID=A0ABU2YX53_9ACTN|nr:hypothetical protein [Streptomyces sp. DSM 3412]MDT0568901.1 hypothetical protein [Streptomyces sp. DSM 3412]